MGYLGHRLNSSPGGTPDLVMTKPTECVEGGWLFALIGTNINAATYTIEPRLADNITPDPLWLPVDNDFSSITSSTAASLHIFAKKVLASEAGASGPASYTFHIGPSNRTYAAILLAYDGLKATNPVLQAILSDSAGENSVSVECPNVTSTRENQYIIRCGVIRQDANFATLTGYTEQVDWNNANNNISLFWQELLKANPGVTSQSIVTATLAGEHVGATLLLDNDVADSEVSTLAPDGVAASSGYANASTANIANILGDPDTPGGTGFTAN